MVKTPDVARFVDEDYQIPVLGLCALCITSNNNASKPMVAVASRGIAKDCLNCRVHTPGGMSLLLEAGGIDMPAGPEFPVEFARLFGGDMTFTTASGIPVPMFAVTIVNGNMVCASHAYEQLMSR